MEQVYYEDELSSGQRKEPRETLEEPDDKEKSPSLGKPFLKISHLKKGNPENELILLEWLDFLFSKKGMEGFIETLSYYVDLGWIQKEVRSYLISYARGMMKEKGDKNLTKVQMGTKKYSIGKKSEVNGPNGSKNQGIERKDHIRSLVYILEILKEKIPEETYERILERAEMNSKQ